MVHGLRALLAVATAAMLSGAASGCSKSSQSSTRAVEVGKGSIAASAIDHWATVLDVDGVATAASKGNRGLRAQAADTLIDAAWLEGETKQLGIAATAGEVESAIARKIAGEFPGGSAEYRTYLAQAGQTPADARLMIEKELDAAKLRAWVLRDTPSISSTAIAGYYHSHLSRYRVPEQRLALITNRKAKAEGEAARRAELAGGSMIPARQRKMHELWLTVHTNPHDHNPYEAHIYAARRGELVGPFKWGADYILFKVLKITPAGYKPLKDVEGAIHRQLKSEHEQQALTSFISGWRERWRAQTVCGPDVVVSKCSEYHGDAHESTRSFT